MIHCLLPRPPCWGFVKGDFEPPSGSLVKTDIMQLDFIKAFNPTVYDEIVHLHNRFIEDRSFQTKIDCYLPLAALIHEHADILVLRPHRFRHFILQVSDAPQFATLPDIGYLLRACLFNQEWNRNVLCNLLHVMFPCPKPMLKQPVASFDDTVPALLNIVLGFLLGLCPQTVKTPPFVVRTLLYMRVHRLLTARQDHQFTWVKDHQFLCCLALCEYVCKLLPLYMPIEYAILTNTFPVQPFFQETPMFYDIFRQENLLNGDETWDDLETKAKALYEKIHRMYKSRCRNRGSTHLRVAYATKSTRTLHFDEIAEQLHCPVIQKYQCHRELPKQILNEYATLGCNLSKDSLCNYLFVDMLPSNILERQLQIIARQAAVCQRQAYMHRMLFICVFCEHNSRKTMLRICVQTQQLVCEECKSAKCVIGIDTVGRVVRSNYKQYFFSPCCGRVVSYATSTKSPMDMSAEQMALSIFEERCPHVVEKSKKKRFSKQSCSFCKASATPATFYFFDVNMRDMRLSYCCQRHILSNEAISKLKYHHEFEEKVFSSERSATKKRKTILAR